VIPKVIHRIWLGPKPIPEESEGYWQRFSELHPGWELRTWTDNDYSWLANQELFESARTWTSRSDVLRFELLARYGGVYVDVDIEPLRSLEPLLGHGAFAGWEDDQAICGAVMGAEPAHPAVGALVDALPAWTVGRPNADPSTWAGPRFLTAQWRGREDVMLLRPEAFYPIHWRNHRRSARYGPRTYAVHHWAKNWGRVDDPSLSILMCWTDRGDPWRRQVKEWVETYWRAHIPEAEFVIGTDGGGEEFSRSAAFNDAASRATGEVCCFLDADCVISSATVLEAARLVQGARIWVVPWHTSFRMTEEATRSIIGSNPASFDPPNRPRARDFRGRESGIGLRFGGFCEVLPRAAFEAVGGWPEAFQGWGSEDIGFSLAMDTLWGPHYVPRVNGLHLWHPRPELRTRNAAQEIAFWEAFGDEAAMRTLTGVDGNSIPELPRPALPRGWLSSDSLRRVPRQVPGDREAFLRAMVSG
jgi:inositol phosphorylceramide mannosyltransferase catalytic subunit